MKKFLLLNSLLILIISCQSKSDFNEPNKFYKGTDEKSEIYLTFINDTIVAFNSDSLKACSWNFMKFHSDEKGLYKTNKLKTDTAWLKPKEGNIIMTATNENIVFKRFELPKSKIDNIKKEIEMSQIFSDKGILFECEYTFKEVGYFYEKAVQKAKYNLKNPNSAKFNEAYIHRHKGINENGEYLETTTTLVSLDVEAKNGFGNFTEDTYYVFFIPRENDKENFDIEFSDSPVLDYETRKKIRFK